MVDLESNGCGVGDQVRGWAQHDGIGETGELLEIGLRVHDLVAPDFLPDYVCGLGQYEIRDMQHDSVGEKLPGLSRAFLGKQPFDGDAGVDDQLQRSRSSRRSETLSV